MTWAKISVRYTGGFLGRVFGPDSTNGCGGSTARGTDLACFGSVGENRPIVILVERFIRVILVVLLVVVAAVLLFWRLDGALLWRDEATTANWGRMMAENGTWLPWVFDGKQLVVQAPDGHDVNSKLLPAMHTYLQFYVAAASFKLLGADTVTARLPFACLGALTLFLMYRLGVLLFGPGLKPLLLPYLSVLSIYFLSAARQSRYYILVVLAATWLILEFCRYLRDPELAGSRSFYVRVACGGIMLYLSNYVAFGGMWAALGLFVLLVQDKRLIRGFFTISCGLGAVLGIEFWLLHSEFAAVWPPPDERSLADLYHRAVAYLGRDNWRTVPFLILAPAAFSFFGPLKRLPKLVRAGMLLSVLLLWSPLLFWFTAQQVFRQPQALFWAGAALCAVIPAVLLYGWMKFGRQSFLANAALLGVVVVVVSPAVAILIGNNSTQHRHYYQIVPAAVIVGAIVVAELARQRNLVAAGACFLGLAVWPNLSFRLGPESVVERQYLGDTSHNGPVVEYLREHVSPDETVAFFRNVKGMAVYFHLPKLNWVALLDTDAPHNQQFRGRIPDDQFDDYADVDWYVMWMPRSGKPKGLTDAYDKVWEYSYPRKRSWWDSHRRPRKLTYEVFRRIGK